jgi:predicted AlkP superfamily pyrophosphatase or phosphodiesterase
VAPGPATVAALPAPAVRANGPRLIVAVVIDQLPSWALERYRPLLDERSVLRDAMARGAYYERALFEYAGTYTAPGHATIFTGVQPRAHGVVANEVWDPTRLRVVSVVDNAQGPVLGAPDQFASPSVLRVETVADALERQTSGRALTVSLSFKDRAAVLPGGQRPDLALFYDAKRGAFTTSSHYASERPAWLGRFEQEQPISARLGPWLPNDPVALERLLGQDAGEGEANWLGLGTVFPHVPASSPDPLLAFRATPAATDYLFELAAESVRTLGLGTDDVPDLLMLSISGVDYAGHIFGPESWEYADTLVRTDRALTRFLESMGARAPLRVLLTTDHGVAPLPERSRAQNRPSVRILTKKLLQSLNASLAGRFGLKSPPVASYTEPFVYLSLEAKASPAYVELLDAVATEVRKTPGVAATYRIRDVVRTEPATELDRLVRASVSDDAIADLFVVPAEFSVVDPSSPGGAGTSHGSPWLYDREVPVLFWGPGVAARHEREPVSMLRVAATLAELLGIAPPSLAHPEPLPGLGADLTPKGGQDRR